MSRTIVRVGRDDELSNALTSEKRERIGFVRCRCGSQVQAGRICTRCRTSSAGRSPDRFVRLSSEATHPCGAKCQFAKGEDCACQCEGLNHGIANRYGGAL